MRMAVALLGVVVLAGSAQAQSSAASSGWSGFNFPLIGGPDARGTFAAYGAGDRITPTMRAQRDRRAADLVHRVRAAKAANGGTLTAVQERGFVAEAKAIYGNR